ncbi:MAG TPA: signal peptidase I [Actinomycetota bacterium]
MAETKELLRAALQGIEPLGDGLDAVERRVASRRRRVRLEAAALALALTAGMAVVLLSVVHGGGGGAPVEGGPHVVGPTLEVEIPSGSMEPTLTVGDVVLVDEGAYGTGIPERGDVIAFRLASDGPDWFFFKRVAGLPGDVVEERHGVIFVNGTEFPMPVAETPDRQTLGPWTVEPGHLFVVGDNLENSNDSRYPAIGQVPVKAVVGKVVEILEPGSRQGEVLPAPPAGVAPGPATPSPSVSLAPSPASTADESPAP